MKHVAIMLYTVGLAVATLSTQAVRAQTPVGTAFTYQGQLKQGGVPVNGAADIQFTLWSAPVDGDAQGTIEFVGVDVRNGLFTVSLDFGAGGFDGSARWLEIHVCYPPDAGPFLPLSPRQRISPTPYALALPGLRTQQNDTSPNVIGGWRENAVTVGVVGATISGGGATISDLLPNRVTDDYGAIGGGANNVAGSDNEFADDSGHATVGGGHTNEASAHCATIGGGEYNSAGGRAATVGGGATNLAGREGDAQFTAYATVGGGSRNFADSWAATVGGGWENAALGGMSTVPGGSNNIAGGQYSLAAGQRAWVRTASDVGGDDTNGDEGTFVWSDSTTPQGDYFTSTGPNQFLIRATGGVGIGTSNPANALSVVGRADFSDRVGVGTANPGSVMADAMLDVADGHIALSNGYGVLASNNTGTGFGAGFDTRPDDGLDLYAGGAGRVRITPDGNVGIGTTDPTHRVQSTDTQAGTLSYPLKISNKGNTAGTAVGMLFQVDVGEPRGKGAIAYERTGSWNRGDFHILQNLDDGPDVAGLDDAVVTIKNNGRIGIGTRTPTTHLDITVAGISHAGVNIKNTDSDQRYLIQVNGTNPGDADRVGNLEIWGSGAGGNHNVFTATSNGNVGIRNQKPEHPLQVGTTFLDGNKAHVTAGGVWTNGSDRDSKRNFEQVDKKAILEQVVDLSVTKWQYKGEDDAIRHIGPVAQDFHEAFGLGGSDKHIGTLDADGVALAAIQGLYEMVKGKDAEIETLCTESARLRARLESLEALVAKLNKSRNGGE